MWYNNDNQELHHSERILDMKKNNASLRYVLALLLLLLVFLSSCSDSPSAIHYSFEDTDGGVVLTAVNVRTRSLDIPDAYRGKPVVAISDSAFYRSEDLRKVTIPSSVQVIGINAFADCEKLNTVVFEEGGECTILEGAFSGCILLRTVKLNHSVTAIGERAFMNCKRISKVEVGSELTEIGYDAFMGCEQMLFKAPENSYAAEYAETNHLTTSFFDTDTFFYLQLVGAVILGIVTLALIKAFSKKRKKNQKTS